VTNPETPYPVPHAHPSSSSTPHTHTHTHTHTHSTHTVIQDIALFAFCGAIGQVFIFHTLERFGSLSLVTVTVTRKMFSILLSVILFNHSITPLQWVSVGMVFAGIAMDAFCKPAHKAHKAATSPTTSPTKGKLVGSPVKTQANGKEMPVQSKKIK
jgi:UDP-galactose transporter B1